MSNEQALREALQSAVGWLASYPGGGPMTENGAYEQARAALALPASAHGAEPSDAERLACLRHGQALRNIASILHNCQPGKERDIMLSAVKQIHHLVDMLDADTPPAAVGGYPKLPEREAGAAQQDWYTADQMHAYVDADRAQRAALAAAPAAQAGAVPVGFQLVPVTVTEEMHVAAVKVLHRANGLDGLPQRMLDAMLAAAPSQPAPAQPDAADAARYRWLRTYPNNIGGAVYGPRFDPMCGGLLRRAEYLDSAIDAALAAQAVAKGGDRG